jgi:hypothetical protein
VKENEKANLEDGIIQLDELKVLPSSPIIIEPNIGVLEATKKPQEENLVAIVTSNLKAIKHGQEMPKLNNPPANIVVS